MRAINNVRYDFIVYVCMLEGAPQAQESANGCVYSTEYFPHKCTLWN